MRYQWQNLNHLQVGAYSEYFVKMEFTMYGFQVYSTEVDDRGIDFVTRFENGSFLSIQVKSIRGLNYVFIHKDKFHLSPNLLLALVILNKGLEPEMFLINSVAWLTPNTLLVSRDYEGKQSEPEWGINLSQKNLPILEQYRFDKVIQEIIANNQ